MKHRLIHFTAPGDERFDRHERAGFEALAEAVGEEFVQQSLLDAR
jgi:hypothetical protein